MDELLRAEARKEGFLVEQAAADPRRAANEGGKRR